MTVETNAEQLKRIKKTWFEYRLRLVDDDMDWLIRQAELSEKRYERYKVWYEGAKKAMAEREAFRQENTRIREAIKKLLEKHKWNNEESAQILEKALAGDPDD